MKRELYAVYEKDGQLVKFQGNTWASSERQAVNNVVYRRGGKIPADRRPLLFGQVIEGAGTKVGSRRPTIRKHSWPQLESFLGFQLLLPGV
ncbi:MAG: hypothetical protein A2589_00170 [Candidatus Vogelbacteria bacterium RIFOXYD1_FULL_46_19]|uniref:Uncharacterized protein n=1 Tax=Candidatus Vogelbacteria bacterium RIFOXYD1_FULL_46_19 TaxID=1802439 RepID=A0A1G2QHM8_9BACT|nr:MAG: hypothetical protein A2589_00170 [Candidatus Vogelbacteria bacterium RIFOXYD1_FULL_46_19]